MATIPDELLEEIFLGPPTPDALARAAAAATTSASFRRTRPLHRGFLLRPGRRLFFLLLYPSRRPKPLPRRRARPPLAPPQRPRRPRPPRLDLPFSLHPGGELNKQEERCCNVADFNLTVCDPLFQRYMLLPTIPEDLAAQPQDLLWAFKPLLAPNTGDDDSDDQHFKVICIARYQTKLVLFIFTSATREWCMVNSPVSPSLDHMSCFDCVGSCFYWTEPWGWSNHLMVLDTRTMSFSTVNLLTGHHKELRDNLAHQSLGHRRPNAVVLGREGAIEMVSLVRRHGSFALHHTSLQNNSHEWKLEKIVQLPGQYRDYSISMVGAAEGFLFFRAAPQQDERPHNHKMKDTRLARILWSAILYVLLGYKCPTRTQLFVYTLDNSKNIYN
uniref:F-box domain-containing protein n=1 Tax=Aegilops tauschii TaxID=37682 RepID=R7W6R9_AEGTA